MTANTIDHIEESGGHLARTRSRRLHRSRLRFARLAAVAGLLVVGLVAAANPAGAATSTLGSASPSTVMSDGTVLFGPYVPTPTCYAGNCGNQGVIGVQSACNRRNGTAATTTTIYMPTSYTSGGWYALRQLNRDVTANSAWRYGAWKNVFVPAGGGTQEFGGLNSMIPGHVYEIQVQFAYAPAGATAWVETLTIPSRYWINNPYSWFNMQYTTYCSY